MHRVQQPGRQRRAWYRRRASAPRRLLHHGGYLAVPGLHPAFNLSITAFVPASPDYVVTAPGTWTGTTCGALNDCATRTAEEHIYEVTIPTAGNWSFGLCNTVTYWDSYLTLTTEACGGTDSSSGRRWLHQWPGPHPLPGIGRRHLLSDGRRLWHPHLRANICWTLPNVCPAS